MVEVIVKGEDKKREQHKLLPHDYIPYACHYNDQTLLTKNGELLQTFKITGFKHQSSGGEKLVLREEVRKAVLEYIDSAEYALWFHTVRKPQSMAISANFNEGFADYVNHSWNIKHDLKNQYMNELFVTVVRAASSAKISTMKNFMRAVRVKKEAEYRYDYLKKSHDELNDVVNNIIEKLSFFEPQKLSVVTEENGNKYSEQLQFFSRLFNLSDIKIPMMYQDVSTILTTHTSTFGLTSFEVSGYTGTRYASILTLKESKELSISDIDAILQLPHQITINEPVIFVNKKKAASSYMNIHYLISLSGDDKLLEETGIQGMVNGDASLSKVNYIKHQTNIIITVDDQSELERVTIDVAKTLQEIGLMFIREDIRLEDAFYGMLPANFPFLKRTGFSEAKQIAEFASLYNYNSGQAVYNYWGSPVCVFKTTEDNPYFFNFHDGDRGHTLMVGSKNSIKSILLNFLLVQSTKFNPKIFLFDSSRQSKVTLKALRGDYTEFHHVNHTGAKLNPFHLEDTERNRGFLANFIQALCVSSGHMMYDGDMDVINEAIAHIYSLPKEGRTLSKMVEWLHNDGRIPDKFALWHGPGDYATMFDNYMDTLDLSNNRIHGFEIEDIINEGTPIIPLLMYILHKVSFEFDGSPVIIVLNDAWRLLDNPLFEPILVKWMEFLKHHNVVIIFATDDVVKIKKSHVSDLIVENVSTQIYLSNENPSSRMYQKLFGATNEEFGMIKSMRMKHDRFMIKQSNETIIASMNTEGMDEIKAVLDGLPEHVLLMENAIEHAGETPSSWLNLFFDEVMGE